VEGWGDHKFTLKGGVKIMIPLALKEIKEVNMLKEAGFNRLANKKEVHRLGIPKIAVKTVQKFSELLGEQDKEFDVQEIEQYEPNGKELIPLSEINKITEVTKRNLFDKMLVVGTKKLQRREIDPIVVGIFEGECGSTHCTIDDWVDSHDWYFIAGWK